MEANAVWIILIQYGYKDLHVVDGGAENLIQHVQKRDIFRQAHKCDEVALYDYDALINETGK